ncbi:MAG: hypothetical protein AB8B64_03220 [Granulosicoccus sp.]
MSLRYRNSRIQNPGWLLMSLSLSVALLQACSGSSPQSPETTQPAADPATTPAPADPSNPESTPVAEIYSPEFLSQFDDPFAAGFDANTVFFRTFRFDNSTGSSSADVSDDAIVLRAESDGTGFTHRYVRLGRGIRAVTATAEFDAQTALSVESNSFASVGLTSDLYNILADNGVGGDNPSVGNVNIDFRVGISGSGQSRAQMCLGSYGEEDIDPVVIQDDGSNCWFAPSSLELSEEESFTFGYEFNFDERTLMGIFNDDRITVDLPGDVFIAFGNQELGFQATQENGPGIAVARLTSLQLDDQSYDFATDRVVLDQIDIFSNGDAGTSQPSVVDGQVQLSIASVDGNYQEQSLAQLIPSDYLEATITLSSRSLLETGRVQSRLESVLYSDVPEDERDGRTGDVRASIELNARADGTREAEICLVRSNDAQFDDQQGLLDNGERRCRSLAMRVELDTPYRVAIALDRFASTVVFRINGIVVIEDINTSIFNANEPFARIVANAEGGASVVALIDNLRTTPTALTEAEVRMGFDMVPEFPVFQPPEPANSDITPIFDHAQSLDFIDDFTVDSRQFGFNDNTQQGDSGIGYSMGGIELRANSAPEFSQRGNYSELYINGDTQAIAASVSLSSASSLPADPDARATVRVQGSLIRDNLDFEPNDRTGDIYSSVEFSLRGDGRRRISYYVSRRVEGGDDERIDILDGEDGGVFEEFTPALDTVYELGIRFDAERNSLIFSVDDMIREFALPWQAFQAAQNDAIVQVQHNGSSGRAIGSLFSVETDSVTENFIASIPLMGPYRPAFEARFRSQSVQVIDGRLRLSSDARVTGHRPARLIGRGTSDYIGANLMLSSESIIAANDAGEGQIEGRVGALVYRTQAFDDPSNNTGNVYASLSLVSTSTGETFAEYCAFESTDHNFDSSRELIGGDAENCPRFNAPVLLDTEYPVSISFDKEARSLVFSIGSEQATYDIRDEIIATQDGFQGPQARASGLSQAVVFVDDLAFSSTAIPLAMSSQRLVIDDTQ